MSSKRKYGAPSRSSYSRKSKRTRYTAMAQKASIPAVLRSRGGEVKLVDIPSNGIVVDSTGTLSLLNGIQEGAGQVNRIGRKISMKSLRISGFIRARANDGSQSSGDYVRLMVIYDRQPNGSAPAPGDILQSFDQTGASSVTAYSNTNLNNADRFMIVRDKRIAVPNFNNTGVTPTSSTGALLIQGLNEPSFNIDMYCKLNRLETHYKSSSNPSVISDISTGALYLLVYGLNGTAASCLQLAWTSRLRYNDS